MFWLLKDIEMVQFVSYERVVGNGVVLMYFHVDALT